MAPDLHDPNVTVITAPEFADLTQISRTSAYALLRSGEVPSVRLGGSVRIPASWVRSELGVDVTR